MRWSITEAKRAGIIAHGPSLPPDKTERRNSLTKAIRAIALSVPSGEVIPGSLVAIRWEGMRLLTLNELLRFDYRQLHAYRAACHDAVRNAVWSIAGRSYGLRFEHQVTVELFRSGKRLVDTDGLYASFKFLIDGFRKSAVINDDDPLTIVEMTHQQLIGEPIIGVTLSKTGR